MQITGKELMQLVYEELDKELWGDVPIESFNKDDEFYGDLLKIFNKVVDKIDKNAKNA
jgi:hypothetical protein